MLAIPCLTWFIFVQVAGILVYHAIVKLCKNSSNWVELGVDGNLPETPQGTADKSLFYLRNSLIKQKRLYEACGIVRTESRLVDSIESLSPFQEWLGVSESERDRHDEVLMNQTAFTRTFYADRLHDFGLERQAREELSNASTMIEPFSKGDISTYNPRLHLLGMMVLCDIDAVPDPIERSDQVLKFAEIASKAGETHIRRMFIRKASKAADQTVDDSASHPLLGHVIARRDQVLLQYLDFEVQDAQCVYYTASCLSSIGFFMQQQHRSSEWLECFSDFEASSKDFDVPGLGVRLYKTAKRAALIEGREDQAKTFEKQSYHFEAQCPYIRLGAEGNIEAITDDPNDYIHEWGQEVPGASDIIERHMFISSKIILRWALSEVKKKQLFLSQAKVILCWDYLRAIESTDADGFEFWSQALEPETLRDAIYGAPKSAEPQQWDSWLEVVEPWLKRSDLGPSILHRHHLLKAISRCHINWWGRSRIIPMPKDLLVRSTYEYRKDLDVHQSIDQRVVARQDIWQFKSSIATNMILLGLSSIARTEGLVNDQMLIEATSVLEELVASCREDGRAYFLHSALKSLANCSWTRYLNYKNVSPHDSLKYLREADEVFRDMLKTNSILEAPRSFYAKHTLADSVDQHEVYNSAVRASLAAFLEFCTEHVVKKGEDPNVVALMPEYQSLGQHVIEWTQKSKSRSLTDVIGLGARIPTAVFSEAQKTPSAIKLLDYESKLMRDLETATLAGKMHIRKSLSELYKAMRSEATLTPLMNIYEGSSITSAGLQGMCAPFSEDIIFVDWVHVRWQDAWDLAILLYRNGLFVGFFELPLKLKDVKHWVRKNLDPIVPVLDDQESKFCPLIGQSASRALRQMEPLTAPLEAVKKPGELLVFCPTLALHRLPLHALNLGGQPLIARNPIVYCQSLNLLRLCLLPRIDQAKEGTAVYIPMLLNPLSNEKETAKLVEEVSGFLGASVQPQTPNPKQTFISQASQSTVVHFHGHVKFSESDPLQHHLELAPVPDNPETQLSPDQILTAQEIFGLTLPSGRHVTTISCKSGRAKISQSNELLGLIASLHYAGASSVVSSLWNIHRNDGAEFSKHFYDDMMTMLRFPNHGGDFITLARAMQRAVLSVRQDEQGRVKAPYHWAGLVLNGAWIMGRDKRWEYAARSEPDVNRTEDLDLEQEKVRARSQTL